MIRNTLPVISGMVNGNLPVGRSNRGSVMFSDKHSRKACAVVTGAGSGIGEAFDMNWRVAAVGSGTT